MSALCAEGAAKLPLGQLTPLSQASTAPSTPAFCPLSEPGCDQQGPKPPRADPDASAALLGDAAECEDSSPPAAPTLATLEEALEEALEEVRGLVSDKFGRDATDSSSEEDEDEEEEEEATAATPRPRSDATSEDSSSEEEEEEELLDTFDLAGVARYIEECGVSRIVVCCGAGISTSAGIPDFRSPGTGLYDNLQRFELPEAECMFDLEYFQEHPEPFYELCKDMWPGKYRPTASHHFLRLLADRGLLQRVYTQNIDSLEREAGLPAELVVAAHGNFDGCHVVGDSAQEVPPEELRAALAGHDGGWRGLQERRGGLVKPNITFFGEDLPGRFFSLRKADLRECELLIVMGTSLAVSPFNELVSMAPRGVPRLLMNRDPVGLCERLKGGFCFHRPDNCRDVFYRGDCDSGARQLARKLGWAADLRALVEAGAARPTREEAAGAE